VGKNSACNTPAKFAWVFQPRVCLFLNIHEKLRVPVEEANISFYTKEGSQDITRAILRLEPEY